jgi:hypothetical protein
MVHRFLSSVRKVQRIIRDYLRCKRARQAALTILWERLETRFVKVGPTNNGLSPCAMADDE